MHPRITSTTGPGTSPDGRSRPLASFGDVMRDGLAVTGRSTRRSSRIRAAHVVFSWMEKVFADAPPLPSTTRPRKK